jgi:hypothetical protein
MAATPTAVGVWLVAQLEVVVIPTWLRAQGLVSKVPAPEVWRVAVPVGNALVPVSVSLTVTVQLVEVFTATLVGAQTTVVEVLRVVAVTAKPAALVLAAWVLSAP